MTKTFSPFDKPEPAAPDPQREAERALLVLALGTPAGQQWLQRRLSRELSQPSYLPGDEAAAVAYREGRKAMLQDLARELHAAQTRKIDA